MIENSDAWGGPLSGPIGPPGWPYPEAQGPWEPSWAAWIALPWGIVGYIYVAYKTNFESMFFRLWCGLGFSGSERTLGSRALMFWYKAFLAFQGLQLHAQGIHAVARHSFWIQMMYIDRCTEVCLLGIKVQHRKL